MLKSRMNLRQKSKVGDMALMIPGQEKQKSCTIYNDPKLNCPVTVVLSPIKRSQNCQNADKHRSLVDTASTIVISPIKQTDLKSQNYLNRAPSVALSPIKHTNLRPLNCQNTNKRRLLVDRGPTAVLSSMKQTDRSSRNSQIAEKHGALIPRSQHGQIAEKHRSLVPTVLISPMKLTDLKSQNCRNADERRSLAITASNILNTNLDSDPKLKLACKVRVLRMNFTENRRSSSESKELKTPSPRSKPDCSSMMCKVQLRKVGRTKKVRVISRDQIEDRNRLNESGTVKTITEDERNTDDVSNEKNTDKFNMVCKVHVERIGLARFINNVITEDIVNNDRQIASDKTRRATRIIFDQDNLDLEETLITSPEKCLNEKESETSQGNELILVDNDVHNIELGPEKVSTPVDDIVTTTKKLNSAQITQGEDKVSKSVDNVVATNERDLANGIITDAEGGLVANVELNCENCVNNGHLHKESQQNSNVLREAKAKEIDTDSGTKGQKLGTRSVKMKAPLSDHNRIIPKKRERKKKPPLERSIPKIVVEKCTERVPVYNKEVSAVPVTDENKSDTYEFDSDSGPAEKPAKIKRPRKPRAPKKRKNFNNIYDMRIKEIMGKLAATINSNKIIAKEIPKVKKNVNGVFPKKTVRIQAKKLRVRFQNTELNENLINENNKENTFNNKKLEENNVNNIRLEVSSDNSKILPENNCDNSLLPQPKRNTLGDSFCGFNDRSIRISKLRTNIMKGYSQRQEQANNISDQLSSKNTPDKASTPVDNTNDKIVDKNIAKNNDQVLLEQQTSVVEHAGINYQADSNIESVIRPTSPSSVHDDDDHYIPDFGFDDDSSTTLPNQTVTKCWRYSANGNTSKDNLIIEDTEKSSNSIVRVENDVSFVRPASACSTVNIFESTIDDDPYFGFDDSNDENEAIILPSNESGKDTEDIYQNRRKRTPPDVSFRKTGSPWRYSLVNFSYNPHFVKLKNNGLPVMNQDPVLDYTYDDNILQHNPALNDSERRDATARTSPVQKSILNYITTTKDITQDKENVPRQSLFDNEDFSPIKINETPKRPAMKKTKRNILGALNSNIIVHSVQVISTPLRPNIEKQVESPDLSAIFDDLKDDRVVFRENITCIRNRRKANGTLTQATDEQEVIIEPTLENIHEQIPDENIELQVETTHNFHGFTCNSIEAAKIMSDKLKELSALANKENNGKQIVKRQTYFGFETVIEEPSDVHNNDDNNNKNKDGSDDAKPFRLSMNKMRKSYRRKAKELQAEEGGKDTSQNEAVDSDEDFDVPTPVPEYEPLKFGLFEDIKVEKANRTYVPKKRRRRIMSVESEPEEEHDRPKKRRKDQMTKHELEDFEKWASDFNKMCEEVELFPLEIE